MSEIRVFATFRVDGLYFGVEVERVQEVLRYQNITRVPLAPMLVSGLINLRGQIVTAIDLRRRLGRPERTAGRNPMNVIIRTVDGPVSLLVDEIGEVLQVKQELYELPPETIDAVGRQFIRGVYKLEKELLLILHADRVVSASEIGWQVAGGMSNKRPNGDVVVTN